MLQKQHGSMFISMLAGAAVQHQLKAAAPAQLFLHHVSQYCSSSVDRSSSVSFSKYSTVTSGPFIINTDMATALSGCMCVLTYVGFSPFLHTSRPPCAQGGTSKPTAGGKAAAAGAAGISTAGGVGVGLEEEIKKLQRAQKFGKLSEQDEKKLTGLQKKLEAQKEKQRLALDKVRVGSLIDG
jgi:hypothetical protein